MSEEIGEFKVVIKGEVDPKISKNIEKSISEGGSKGAEKASKEFERKLTAMAEKPSFKNLFAFAENIKIPGFNKSETVQSSGGAAEGAAEGAAAGGIKGAAIGAIVGLLAKISVGIMALQAVMSLGPVQAMLKMITAILQITLYPIVTFFLAIFKPILVLLLQYLILPFYYNVMPILEKLGAFIGSGIVTIASWIFSTFLEPIYNIIVGLFKFVTTIFTSIVSIIVAALKVVFNLLINLGQFIITILASIFKSAYSIFVFFGKLITGLITLFFGPLIEAVADLSRGPAGVADAMRHLTDWVGGMGARFGAFASTMGTAWDELIGDISTNINAIISAGVNVFTTLAADLQNFATVALTAISEVFAEIVTLAATMSEESKKILFGMAEGIINIWVSLGKTVDGILKGLGIDLGIDFDAIGTNFKEMIEKLKKMDLTQINTIFADMLEKMRKGDFGGIVIAFADMINAFKKKIVDTVLPIPIIPPPIIPPPSNVCSGDYGCDTPCNTYHFGENQCALDLTPGCASDIIGDQACHNDIWANYTGMATGGIVTSPTRALIGESGPEAVIPLPGFLSGGGLGNLVRGNSAVNTKLQNVGGNTITVNFNNTKVSSEFDLDDIVEKIERSLYVNSKRAGIR